MTPERHASDTQATRKKAQVILDFFAQGFFPLLATVLPKRSPIADAQAKMLIPAKFP